MFKIFNIFSSDILNEIVTQRTHLHNLRTNISSISYQEHFVYHGTESYSRSEN